MSLLSDFLPKSTAAGLALVGDVVTFSKPNAQFVVASTDATASGATYPRIIARNAYQATGSGGEFHFEAKNDAANYVVAAKIKGSLSTLSAGGEVGQIDLLPVESGAFGGVRVRAAGLVPITHGDQYLGTAGAAFSSLSLYDTADGVSAYLTPGTTTTLAFSGTNLQIKSASKSYNLAVSATGVGVFNVASVSSAMLAVGDASNTSYYSQSALSAANGVNVDMGIPSGVTSEANGIKVKVTQASATFTTTTVAGVKVLTPATQGASAITTAYGVYIQPQTNATTGIGLYADAATSWGVVADGPKHFFKGGMIVRDTVWAGGLTTEAYVDVRSTATSTPLLKLKATSASYGDMTGMARIEGPDNDSTYALLHITDTTTANVKLQVRGDGAVLIGTDTPSASGKLTVAGRVAVTGDDNYNIGGNAAVDLYVSGTHTVPINKFAASIYVTGSFALAGASRQGYGLLSSTTASSSSAGSDLYAAYLTATNPGAGNVYGGYFYARGDTGHTGVVTGALIGADTVAGSSAASSGVTITHASTLGYGIFIDASVAGATLTHGVYVNNTNAVGTAAFAYYQRAGSTADAFRYLNSSNVATFQVSSTGNIISPNLTTFDNTDVRVGPGTLATGSTAGHLYIPAVGGSMTGVPTSRSGWAPLAVNTTNGRLESYYGGAWHYVALT